MGRDLPVLRPLLCIAVISVSLAQSEGVPLERRRGRQCAARIAELERTVAELHNQLARCKGACSPERRSSLRGMSTPWLPAAVAAAGLCVCFADPDGGFASGLTGGQVAQPDPFDGAKDARMRRRRSALQHGRARPALGRLETRPTLAPSMAQPVQPVRSSSMSSTSRLLVFVLFW